MKWRLAWPSTWGKDDEVSFRDKALIEFQSFKALNSFRLWTFSSASSPDHNLLTVNSTPFAQIVTYRNFTYKLACVNPCLICNQVIGCKSFFLKTGGAREKLFFYKYSYDVPWFGGGAMYELCLWWTRIRSKSHWRLEDFQRQASYRT